MDIILRSPDGRLQATIFAGEGGRLQFRLQRDGKAVLEDSSLGLLMDETDLGLGAKIGEPRGAIIDEEYAVRGGHSLARNHCHTATIPFTSTGVAAVAGASQGIAPREVVPQGAASQGIAWKLEARAFNDGFAYRYRVAANRSTVEGARCVRGEASSWKLPAQSRVWIAERPNNWKLKSYAGWWMSTDVEELPTISTQGPVQAPPLVIELPTGGYAACTEAALTNYSGMRLRAVGERTMQADFSESDGFIIDGEITTPWRVTMVADTLDGLVNSDLLTNLNPPPDPELFADQSWIKPGRCVWRWWSKGTGTPEEERGFVEYAAELGFEYSLVDDGWEDWPQKWRELSEICALGREKGIGVFVWKDYKDIWQPEENYAVLRDFLDSIKDAGACGAKIDFMNAESKDRIDFQMAALRETASRRLMLLFHGCQKPSGEARTWPHEITREGIRGLELNKMSEGPITAAHNAALPFTRFVAGHGDYTPVGYSNPGPTTWAHQLATAIVFTSPLQVIAEHPEKLLHDEATRPALDVLQNIPSVWDETRVLSPSAIGEVAIFARRKGETWFLGALNSEQAVDLPQLDFSFLGEKRYRAVLLSSPQREAFERRELEVGSDFKLEIKLAEGDGFVVWFEPVA